MPDDVQKRRSSAENGRGFDLDIALIVAPPVTATCWAKIQVAHG